ncbi:MAG: hypothetical protein U9R16_04490 [Campylobacterota bacterium]|nr:hypothetical protein [Campylobacterota bacterium]
MTGRRRNYIENIFILAVVAGGLYYSFTLIFTTDNTKQNPITKQEIITPKTTIQPIEEIKQTKEVKVVKVVKEVKSATKIIEKKEPTQISEKKESLTFEQKIDLNFFLKNLKKEINNTITENSDSTETTKNKYLKIRVTVLKDGSFEQLKYIAGEKRYFNSIQHKVKNAFPVNIKQNIQNQFPRYVRMDIKY